MHHYNSTILGLTDHAHFKIVQISDKRTMHIIHLRKCNGQTVGPHTCTITTAQHLHMQNVHVHQIEQCMVNWSMKTKVLPWQLPGKTDE